MPAVAHGFFDIITDFLDTGAGMLIFGVYVIVMFIVSWRMMKKMAAKDARYNEIQRET